MRGFWFLTRLTAIYVYYLNALVAARQDASEKGGSAVAAAEAVQTPRLDLLEANAARRLDVVIVHYHEHTLHAMLTEWTTFLNSPKVKSLEPVVFIYCLNRAIDLGVYQSLIKGHGRAYRLPNKGREAAVYFAHIINYWDNLAEHTLFSQAIAAKTLPARFENLFTPSTGVLALAVFAHEDCMIKKGWLPIGQLAQLYSIFTRRFCPPEGFSAMFNGEFVVSKARIRAQPRDVYEHVNGLLIAPLIHWIHTVHNDPFYKRTSNPFFGHSMERAWSLAFDCHELWRYQECELCDKQKWQGCPPDACQCLD